MKQETTSFRFGSGISQATGAALVATEIVPRVRGGIGDAKIDFAMAFVSAAHGSDVDAIVREIAGGLACDVLVGCTGEGVIGSESEIEGVPAVAVVAASLPGARATSFELSREALGEIDADPAALLHNIDIPGDTRLFVLLGDPFTSPIDGVLAAFNATFPGVPMIGGMASGAAAPGQARLFSGKSIRRDGMVGMALSGELDADVIVSQGCRPVGPVFTITGVHGNIIRTLDGETAMACIHSVVDELSDDDRDLLENGLFVGRAIDSEKDRLGRGDFLIRGVVGVDQQTGAIAIGDYIHEGERVQFHLRDAGTAREDLEMMLTPHSLFGAPSGALLFSCNGRGTRLYERPDGDISAINSFFSGIDVAGFFCAGEIGPVGRKNFLHGHTASLALIRQRGAISQSRATS